VLFFSAEIAICFWRALQKLHGTVRFCRRSDLCPVENAEAVEVAWNPENSCFHPSGLAKWGFGINPPIAGTWQFAGRWTVKDSAESALVAAMDGCCGVGREVPNKNGRRKQRTSLRCA
jgi:hypothetical protein